MSLPAEIIQPGTTLYKLSETYEPVPGQRIVVYSRGRYRVAEVTKVGPKRYTVEYTTPNGSGQATGKSVPRAEAFYCIDLPPTFAAGERAGVVAEQADDWGRRRGGHKLVAS